MNANLSRFFPLALAGVLLTAGGARAATITENFESGATGWIATNGNAALNNRVTNAGPVYTHTLGVYGNEVAGGVLAKTVGTISGSGPVTIDFDFDEVGSWDHETFAVFVNGVQVIGDVYSHFDAQSNLTNAAFLNGVAGDYDRAYVTGHVAGNGGGMGSSSDRGYGSFNGPGAKDTRWHYSLTLTGLDAGALTLAFGPGTGNPQFDEGWAIDNLVVSGNSVEAVPEPTTLALAGAAAALLVPGRAARVRRS